MSDFERRQYEALQKKKEEAKEIVTKISNYVNVMGHDNSLIVKELINEHRTLQQQIFELFLHYIKALSESQYDARNEYAVKKSKEIMELFPNFTRVPFI